MTDKVQKIREEVARIQLYTQSETLKQVLEYIDKVQEEPVSEDLELEESAKHYLYSNILYDDVYVGEPTDKDCIEMFKAGAKWQFSQLEKNRLAACDAQTEEEVEIERDFVIGIIEKEHRQPTFDDAIKYGMRLQKKQMMKDAT